MTDTFYDQKVSGLWEVLEQSINERRPAVSYQRQTHVLQCCAIKRLAFRARPLPDHFTEAAYGGILETPRESLGQSGLATSDCSADAVTALI